MNLSFKSSNESRQLSVSLDAAETLLSFEEPCDGPLLSYRTTAPAFDVASDVLQCTIQDCNPIDNVDRLCV